MSEFLAAPQGDRAIEDAMFWGALERGDSRWEAASVRAQAQPDAGPDWGLDPSLALFGRAIDPKLKEPRADPHFERARQRTRQALQRERVERSGRVEGIGLAPVDALAPVPSGDRPAPDAFQVPPSEMTETLLDGDVHRHLADGDHPLDAARPLAQVARDGEIVALAYIDDAGARREIRFPHPAMPRYQPVLSGDQRTALLGLYSQLVLIDFDTGEARVQWNAEEAGGKIIDVAPAGER